MGILDAIKGQLRSVIEWENDDGTNLFALWSSRYDEIKNASNLVVKPGQAAIFVYEGKIEAVHQQPGLYELATANIPIITTLSRFMQAFESEHKVAIYFCRTTEFLNQKWGTLAPVKYQDPVYQFPVGLRSFGNFSFRLGDVTSFFVNVVGERQEFPVSALSKTLAERLVQPLTDIIASKAFSYTDLDSNREELATLLREKIAAMMLEVGCVLTDFRIDGTDFDEATQEHVQRIAKIAADSYAAKAAGLNYVELQKIEALRDAARNEGGLAGIGAGLAAGAQIGSMMNMGSQVGSPGSPSLEERLRTLQKLKEQGLISEEEFTKKRADILAAL